MPRRKVGRVLMLRRCASIQELEGHGGSCDCGMDSQAAPPTLRREYSGQEPAGGDRPTGVPPIVRRVLSSYGVGLEPSVRLDFEARLGEDLSRVRVHTDSEAAASAHAVGANAYAVGPHLVFGDGCFAPATAAGQKLLAHELGHFVQERSVGQPASDRLEIGSVHDQAEADADRIAGHALNRSSASGPLDHTGRSSGSSHILRRQVASPQRLQDPPRTATIDAHGEPHDRAQVSITRTLVACPCHRVADVAEQVYYNPDLDNLAIVYRRCTGRSTLDTFGRLQSNARAFMQGTPPQGTAQIGIDLNVLDKGGTGGQRYILAAVGSNASGTPIGLGGRGVVVFQGGQWRLALEAQFLRRLQSDPRTGTQNDLQAAVGAQFGHFLVRIQGIDLLSPTARGGQGSFCYTVGSSSAICFDLTIGASGGVQSTVIFRGTFDIGPHVRPEECWTCLCPGPVPHYACTHIALAYKEPHPEERHALGMYRFYYAWSQPHTQSESRELQAQSIGDMAALASEVTNGAQVVSITGRASPEGGEPDPHPLAMRPGQWRGNQVLSQQRADDMKARVRGLVTPATQLPDAVGLGEVSGEVPNRPGAGLASEAALHSAMTVEQMTDLLRHAPEGEHEIPNAELHAQFRALLLSRPDLSSRLALFGVTDTTTPAGQHLAESIQNYLTRPRGGRPWDFVFMHLRYSEVRTDRRYTVPGTIHHAETRADMRDEECRPYIGEASRQLGPIDDTARVIAEDWCPKDSLNAPAPPGCSYELPRNRPTSRPPTGPSYAPTAILPSSQE